MEAEKVGGSNVIRVKLMKQKKNGLGFLVRKRSKTPHVVVSDLVSHGTAAESGLVQIGDVILKVNDVSFENLEYEKSLESLKSLPVNTPVVLILKGPEGYTSHLETRFSPDGVPKTIRITKPILHNDGLISRIKKTFSTNSNAHDISVFIDEDQSMNDNEIKTIGETQHAERGSKLVPTATSNTDVKMVRQNGNITTESKAGPALNKPVNGHHISECNNMNGAVTSLEIASCPGSRRPSEDAAKIRRTLDVDVLERTSSASGKNSPVKKFVKLRNVAEERPMCSDTLHLKSIEPMPCNANFCMGSVMDVGLVTGEPRPKEEVLVHARDFINQYYQSIKRSNTPAHTNRWTEVEKAVLTSGTYELTTAELTFGAKTAWRNAPRCIGRIQWSKLQVFDARHITTARGMFEAICNHIKYGTNKGNIRSAITVFPPRTDGKHDFRVCQKLGWKGKGTRFDVLPLVLQANGHDPELFEIPPELILEVHFKHPKFPWFADMGLRWYALPAVSSMVFDCGGLLFVAAPFNGWFMGTEIGARDLCDPFRYNLLESQGVTITDHHAASDSFMKHLDNEQKLRGGCPADWVWIVPPMSGSLLPVFHQEIAVKFSAKLMGKALARRVKCVILYATETGKSEGFAKTLCQIFKHAFDARVCCMDDYDVTELEHEALVLIVTSTFGNGDPPENGESFAKYLLETKHPDTKDKFSVFGLGSSAYPNFCAFAHYLDKMFANLGAERINEIAEGDELCGQEESFRTWATEVFKAACETFCTGDDRALQDAAGTLSKTDHNWTPDTFRVTPATGNKEPEPITALSTIHNKNVVPCRFMERTQLQAKESDRQTMLIKLDATLGSGEMLYHPGDHVAIFSENAPPLVDAILMRLHNAPPPEQLIKIEVMNERSTPLGNTKSWDPYPRLPVCTLHTAFLRYLDITTPPSQALLKLFATQASKDCDKESLENLTNDSHIYEEWKYETYPNVVQVLDQFPSLRVPASLLLTQLPLLQSRFYSISSSLKHTIFSPGGGRKGWGEIHLYFGCRNSEIDAIYREELEQMKAEGVLTQVYTALSREKDVPKTYVQSILKQNSTAVFRCIVKQSGHFYVCGDVKMASDVTATLEKIVATEGNMASQDAKSLIMKLRDNSRFHEDIFGVTLRSSEVTDRARDQAKRAWSFVNAAGRNRASIDTESVSPIPTGDYKGPKSKPKAPRSSMFSPDSMA
ncbi:NOS1-like protein [Mya arenaria]|uniref:Nitric oxide synthase 1 n=1 Tax=Mya arenaria TaxID=6604 RepID=A0ABY7DWA6_MYAAR|nr:NOS1-like protein [Mya arenaria]